LEGNARGKLDKDKKGEQTNIGGKLNRKHWWKQKRSEGNKGKLEAKIEPSSTKA
jgi:hypothetical protein